MQKQRGWDDCGLFAIAVATAFAFGVDPAEVTFQQDAMRAHLVKRFEDGLMTLFQTAPYLNNCLSFTVVMEH